MPKAAQGRRAAPSAVAASTSKLAQVAAAPRDDADVYFPSDNILRQLFLIARILAAATAGIGDCDETFNYWEPAHYLLHGHGLQTWEYSPEYGLRSYAYVGIHSFLAELSGLVLPGGTKITQFYFVRSVLALVCSGVETYFVSSLATLDRRAAGLAALFLMFSPGMYVSSAAFLPSSFCMYLTMLYMAFWLSGRRVAAVYSLALAVLLGWPFVGVLGVPLAIEMVFMRREMGKLLFHGVVAVLVILGPIVMTDEYYYGKAVIAPLNVAVYNVIAGEGRGPNLYGVEPWTYYIFNGFLNFNVVFLIALSSFVLVPLLSMALPRVPSAADSARAFYWLKHSCLGIWLAIFFLQPHKEERFLYVVYPLIAMNAGVTMSVVWRFLAHYVPTWHALRRIFVRATLLIFVALSVSRIAALVRNYNAPFPVYTSLNAIDKMPAGTNVCVGQEWYRFPSHFFMPDSARLRFVRSHFHGLLPQYYLSPAPNGTRAIPPHMNDLNREEMSRYVDVESCNYVVELCVGDSLCGRAAAEGWKRIKCEPFLDANASPSWTRAFWIPFVSFKRNVYADYCLFQRS